MPRFPKSERLTHKEHFRIIVEEGVGVNAFPIRVAVATVPLSSEADYQIAFSVGKRRFKKAVDRNRLKRLLREAWREKKEEFTAALPVDHPGILVVYIANEHKSLNDIRRAFDKALTKLLAKLEENE